MASDAERYFTKMRVAKHRMLRKAKVEGMVKAALSDEEVRERLKFTEEDIEALNEVIRAPKRHSGERIGALKLKLTVQGILEKERVGGDVVNVVVNTLAYAPDPERTTATASVRLAGAREVEDAEQKRIAGEDDGGGGA